MKSSADESRRRVPVLLVFSVLLMGLVSLWLVRPKKPIAPNAIKPSVCQPAAVGFNRFGNANGFQFDVPSRDFYISDGTPDMLPGTRTVTLTPMNSKSTLEIRYGPPNMPEIAVDPAITFSERSEARIVLDSEGKRVGEDSWGYLETRERWRRIHLKGLTYASYGFANEREAQLFDQVLASACLLSD